MNALIFSDISTSSALGTASCTLKPNSPCWKNSIIDTNDFECAPVERYTLAEIFHGFSVGKGSNAQRLCRWLISILKDTCQYLPDFGADSKYTVERGHDSPKSYYYCIDHFYVPVMEQLLAPLTGSICFKSDVAILWNCISVILCEINSSPMENTVAKLFANLIDLLRYIRHFDNSITSWVGFTFPTNRVNTTNNFACKVEVVWRELKFVCNVVCLRKEDIISEVQATFTKQIALVEKLDTQSPPEHYLVPLSSADLESIDIPHYYNNHTLKQVESKFSLLLTNEKYYFKFPGDMSHQIALSRLLNENYNMGQEDRDECAKHLVFPIFSLKFPLSFIAFPAMKYKLTKEVAKQCLPDLADGIRNGLEKLHSLGLAHLDVRLPNVCVGDDFQVRLIDFDRASSSANVSSYGKHFMYTYETGERIVQNLDWKQFGLLLFTLSYSGEKHQSELVKADIPDDSHDFLMQLIFHHTCDDTLLQQWKKSLSLGQKQFLESILLSGQ